MGLGVLSASLHPAFSCQNVSLARLQNDFSDELQPVNIWHGFATPRSTCCVGWVFHYLISIFASCPFMAKLPPTETLYQPSNLQKVALGFMVCVLFDGSRVVPWVPNPSIIISQTYLRLVILMILSTGLHPVHSRLTMSLLRLQRDSSEELQPVNIRQRYATSHRTDTVLF